MAYLIKITKINGRDKVNTAVRYKIYTKLLDIKYT